MGLGNEENKMGDRVPLRLCLLFAIVAILVTFAAAVLVRNYIPRGEIQAGFSNEFLAQPYGYRLLDQHYGLKFGPEPKQMADAERYKALSDGSVDIINGFPIDGYIPVHNFIVLEDDKRCFPPQQVSPVIRREILGEHPEIADILNRLNGKISNKVMQYLDHEIEEEGRTAADVAREFLAMEGLSKLDTGKKSHSGVAVVVGSMLSTEQDIIGEIMSFLIENHSDAKVIRKFRLGNTVACFSALKSGDIDLYAEYTGNALVSILDQKVVMEPDEAYKTVKRIFENEHDLLWLRPFGLNKVNALIMRQKHAEKLGIATISDLVRYIRRRRGVMPPLTGQF